MRPQVSIITPAYNHGKFIDQAIQSAISQTFADWEMIIVDDCSTDDTFKIALRYAREDKRIKVIRHAINWGIFKLRDTYNQALKLAKGKFIAILESDDFWPKYKLERQIAVFQSQDVVLSFGDFVMTGETGNFINLIIYDRYSKALLNNNPPGSILNLFSDLDFYLCPATAMIRKKTLLDIGGFQTDQFYYFGVDVPSWLSLSLKGKFCHQREILGFYRKQVRSFWFDLAKKTKEMGRRQVQQCLLNFFKTNKQQLAGRKIFLNSEQISEKQEKYLKNKIKRKKTTLFLHYLAFDKKDKAKEEAKKIIRQKTLNFFSLLALLTLLSLPLAKLAISAAFFSKYLFYKTKNRLKFSS